MFDKPQTDVIHFKSINILDMKSIL